MAATVMELYGSKVFNEHEMRERLPSSTYKSLKATIEKGQALDLEVANVVASVMKRWAIEQGATHYTHWFQPLTGITSEKHDGFVSPQPDGTAIMVHGERQRREYRGFGERFEQFVLHLGRGFRLQSAAV